MKKCILNFSRETLMERLLGRELEDNTKTDVKGIKWEDYIMPMSSNLTMMSNVCGDYLNVSNEK
jgi:hypothetical protein